MKGLQNFGHGNDDEKTFAMKFCQTPKEMA